MNQLELIIRLVADLTGGKLTEDQINKIKERYAEMAQESGRAGNVGTDAVRSLVAEFAPFVTIAGAAAAAWESINHAIDAFASHEDRIIGLDAALANHGNLTDAIRAKYRALAEEQEADTKIIADRWLDVFARLTRFGAKPEEMEKYAVAVKNLAGLMGTDIESAGHIFTRVMEGNFQFLHRYGIMVEQTGDKTRDLNRAMELIAAGGAGVLDAKAKALSGTFAEVKNQTTHFFEALGELIARTGIIQTVTGAATGVIKDLTGSMRDGGEAASVLDNKLAGVATAAGQSGEKQAQAAKDATDAIKGELDALDALQSRQDSLTDAMMAGELATAKLNAEKKKFALSPDDKEGRHQIDLQLEGQDAAIRERYTTKRLADEREVLTIKQQALLQDQRAAQQAYEAQQKVVTAAQGTHGEAVQALGKKVFGLDPDMLGLVNHLPELLAATQQGIKAGGADIPGTFAYRLKTELLPLIQAADAAQKQAQAARVALAGADTERGNVGEQIGPQLADVNTRLRVNALGATTARTEGQASRTKAADESQVASMDQFFQRAKADDAATNKQLLQEWKSAHAADQDSKKALIDEQARQRRDHETLASQVRNSRHG